MRRVLADTRTLSDALRASTRCDSLVELVEFASRSEARRSRAGRDAHSVTLPARIRRARHGYAQAVLRALIVSLTVVAVAIAIGGTASPQRATTQVASNSRVAKASCPKGVLSGESSHAPVSVALQAAQRLLARKSINRQGRVFHLTPENAPIDRIQQLTIVGTMRDQTQPGLLAIHRVAAAACGEPAAHASWAIHDYVPRSTAGGAGGFYFLVKTNRGWTLWGNWCGADRSRQWRDNYC